jgi:precorrin-6Y C5,15-methyltransferase (decarboxylating)
MKTVIVIGMGMSLDDLTEKHKAIIDRAQILVGGKRHLAYFEDSPAEKKPITRDIKSLMIYIKAQMATKQVVVLASGDPLFYGIGSSIVTALGKERVRILPNICSVAAAFAHMKVPWGQAGVVSLHGRDHRQKLLQAICRHTWVAVFTDGKKNPAWISEYLMSQGLEDIKIGVFERLGTAGQRESWFALKEAANLTFDEPNLAVLYIQSQPPQGAVELHLGMDEDAFEHESGLITKTEIRAVTLAKLRLLPHHVLWDLGAGSGSVAVEAAALVRHGRCIAVEQNPARVAQIRANMRRFGLTNLAVVQAKLPDGLQGLPSPERIFIGGGGPKLGEIIGAAARYLAAGGIIAVNTVLSANLEIAIQALILAGFETDAIQVQVNRIKAMPFSQRFVGGDPVWIITGRKREAP